MSPRAAAMTSGMVRWAARMAFPSSFQKDWASSR
jgi:hypothetical protein